MDNKTNKHEFACNAGKVTEYEVKEHIDTIMVGFRGFSKEVSIVKWNDKKPVFDIRAWRVSDRDGLQYPLRGITFSKEEFIKLREKFELIRNADLVCTDCLYKYDDTNMPCNVSKCEMYEEKPSTVIDGGNCDLYDKGVSE